MNEREALERNLTTATAFLEKALATEASDIQRAATIKAFEFCFELGWKLLKARLADDGIEVATPRAALRAAGDAGYIDSVEDWLTYLEARNLASHTYNQALAERVYATVNPAFFDAVRKLL